jgi:Mg-chelatase subunit ChlD
MKNIVKKVGDFFSSEPQTNSCREPYPKEKTTLEERPRDAVLAIDTSSSMSAADWRPSRLKAAQESAIAFVERLAESHPGSRVAIVVYSNKADLIIPLTNVKHKMQLQHAINSIKSHGSTNITDALQVTLKILKTAGNGQVILLTDGQHNTGESPHRVADRLKNHAVINCIGIGGTRTCVDEKLLKYIASYRPDGTKRYRWIGDKQGLVEHFQNLAGRISRA